MTVPHTNIEMKVKGTYRYTIDQRDVDFSDRATYVALMNYILQSAGDDADLNGFGVKDLNCDNASWVLSRVAAEFGELPQHGESFDVRTWVNDIGRMMTTRNMVVTNTLGSFVAAVVTQWAIIDLDKREAVDIRLLANYDHMVKQEESPIEMPRRIRNVVAMQRGEHRVVYSDIDFNRHVSAMKYVEWMVDMLPLERLERWRMVRMDINFLNEALYGELLTVVMEIDGDGSSTKFEIQGEGQSVLCRATMDWEPAE